jgi:hypothetical protein
MKRYGAALFDKKSSPDVVPPSSRNQSCNWSWLEMGINEGELHDMDVVRHQNEGAAIWHLFELGVVNYADGASDASESEHANAVHEAH